MDVLAECVELPPLFLRGKFIEKIEGLSLCYGHCGCDVSKYKVGLLGKDEEEKKNNLELGPNLIPKLGHSSRAKGHNYRRFAALFQIAPFEVDNTSLRKYHTKDSVLVTPACRAIPLSIQSIAQFRRRNHSNTTNILPSSTPSSLLCHQHSFVVPTFSNCVFTPTTYRQPFNIVASCPMPQTEPL